MEDQLQIPGCKRELVESKTAAHNRIAKYREEIGTAKDATLGQLKRLRQMNYHIPKGVKLNYWEASNIIDKAAHTF
jgi:hypothetical protein